MYFLAMGLIISRCDLICGRALAAMAFTSGSTPRSASASNVATRLHVRDELGLGVAVVELLARQAGEALGAELRPDVDHLGDAHPLLRGQRPQLVVQAGVLLDHPLAELLQLGIGGPLDAELAEGQLGQAAVGGRGGEEGVVDFGRLAGRPARPAMTRFPAWPTAGSGTLWPATGRCRPVRRGLLAGVGPPTGRRTVGAWISVRFRTGGFWAKAGAAASAATAASVSRCLIWGVLLE